MESTKKVINKNIFFKNPESSQREQTPIEEMCTVKPAIMNALGSGHTNQTSRQASIIFMLQTCLP